MFDFNFNFQIGVTPVCAARCGPRAENDEGAAFERCGIGLTFRSITFRNRRIHFAINISTRPISTRENSWRTSTANRGAVLSLFSSKKPACCARSWGRRRSRSRPGEAKTSKRRFLKRRQEKQTSKRRLLKRRQE